MNLDIMWKIAVVVGALVVGIGSRFVWKKLKNDNPIEEIAEEVIKKQTGLDIDLTPCSPEKKDGTTK